MAELTDNLDDLLAKIGGTSTRGKLGRDNFSLQGSKGYYPPVVSSGLIGMDFVKEHVRQSRLSAEQRFAEGSLPPIPGDQGEFSKGISSGLPKTAALFTGAGAALADIIGADAARNSLIGSYGEFMESSASVVPSVARVEDIHSFGQFLDWAAFQLGEQVINLASIIGTGGVGGIIVRVVAKGAIEKKAGQLLLEKSRGWTEELAKAQAKKIIGRRGIAAGAYTAATGLETGGILGEQVDAGLEIQGGVALFGGSIAGALETATPFAVAKLFGLSTPMSMSFLTRIRDAAMASNRAVRAGTIGVAVSGLEATTETLQEVVAIAARSFVDENYDTLGPESASRMLNAAATGMLMGFVLGSGGGAITSQQVNLDDAEASLLDIRVDAEDVTVSEIAPSAAPPAPEEVDTSQDASINSKPKKITAISSNVESPLQTVPLVDILAPEPTVETPEQKEARVKLQVLRANRSEIKKQPDAYDKRGHMLEKSAEALRSIDEEISELTTFLETQPDQASSLSLVTGTITEDISKLKPAQRTVFARLQDKIDAGETLTDTENTRLDNLMGIITGDPIEIDTIKAADKQKVLNELQDAVQKDVEEAHREKIRAKNIREAIAAFPEDEGAVSETLDETTEGTTTAFGQVLKDAIDSGKAGGIATEDRGSSRVAVRDAQEAIRKVRLVDEGVIVLVQDTESIRDPRVKEAIKKHDNNKFETQALHVENEDGSSTTLFLLDRIKTAERVAALYLHEIIVHHGLNGLPRQERKAIIQLLKRYRRTDIELLAKKRGIALSSDQFQWDHTFSHYGSRLSSFDTIPEVAENLAAEELLAEIAENNDFDIGLFNRIVAIIRRWVRKMLPNWPMNLSHNDVRMILLGLQRRLMKAPPHMVPVPTLAQIEQNLGLPISAAKNIITKFIKALHTPAVGKMIHKGTLTQGQFRNLVKKYSGSAAERDLITSVLDTYTAIRISPAEIEQAIIDKLIVFTHRVDSQAIFVDTAAPGSLLSSVIGADPNDFRSGQRLGQPFEGESQPQFVIYSDTRQDAPFTSGHVYNEPFYRGHIRGLAIIKGNKKEEFLAFEVQSDFAQTLARISSLSKEEVQIALAVNEMADRWNTIRGEAILEGKAPSTKSDLEFIAETKDATEKSMGIIIPDSITARLFIKTLSPAREREQATEDRTEGRTLNMPYLAEQSNISATVGLTSGTEEAQNLMRVYDQVGPAIFKRLIREDVRRAAQAGYPTYSFLHPLLVAEHEGWIAPATRLRGDAAVLESMRHGGHARLYNRYKKLYAWFKKEYNGKEASKGALTEPVAPKSGYRDMTRMVIQLEGTKLADLDIISMAGGSTIAGREATRMGVDEDMRIVIDKLHNPLWLRFLLNTTSMLQQAELFKVKALADLTDRLTIWAAEKAGVIAPAVELMHDTNKKLNKREHATLARLMFSLSGHSDDLNRALLDHEKKAAYAQVHLKWTNVEAEKTSTQLFQERYAAMLDGINEKMQDAAMFQVLYKIIKGGKQFTDNNSEDLARNVVDRYNDTDEFSPGRDEIIEEITLYAGTQANEEKLSLLHDRLITLAHLKNSYQDMRGRNYFPYKRFGKWAVILRAKNNKAEYKGRKFNTDETAGLWTFENRADQESWLDNDELVELHRGGNFELQAFKMSELEESHVDIPPGFLESLKDSLDLQESQIIKLDKLSLSFTPGSKFIAHMMKRRGIDGMAMDMTRVFAAYMQSAGNHIARVNHAARMVDLREDAISQLKNAAIAVAEEQGSKPPNLNGITIFEEELKRHFHYIMEPGNELAWLRALGFTWYLGFNVKSAIINLTQVPMVSFPYLATKYGSGKAFSALMKSMKDATAFTRKDGKTSPLEPWLDKMVARGVRELFLDESLAVELAGVAQGDIMSRVLPSNKVTRGIHQFAYLASLPFQFTEKITRRMVFIATARLHLAGKARPSQQEVNEAYTEARKAVRETIFEYQKWNRPRFMRGKTSSIFLFWTFMQHMLFTLAGGYGKSQRNGVWGMLFITAGTMGLPLMENLLDLLDFGGKHAKKALGLKNPFVDSRLMLRELFQDFPGGADLWMYGLSSRGGLGPLHILDLLGAPIPQTDVQGSTGLGRPIPGLEELMGRARSPEERLGRFAVDVLGPVAAIFHNMMKAAGDTNPDTWKRFERVLPSAFRSISKATRITSRGGESFRRGGSVIDYDPSNMEHNTEMIAQFFGFTPARLNDRYRLRAHQEDHRAYYMTWRQLLLEALNYSKQTNDREGRRDAEDAIKRYNRSIPDRRLRITGKTKSRSFKSTQTRAKLRTEGKAFERGFQNTFREIKDLFPPVL